MGIMMIMVNQRIRVELVVDISLLLWDKLMISTKTQKKSREEKKKQGKTEPTLT